MITVDEQKFEIIEDSRGGLDIEALKEKLTDFFDDYDYIVGDWAYGKLRLKGFNEQNNKKYSKINDCKNIKKYIQDYCAYGCKYFIIKRINID
jgi:uncharacterized protein YutD